MNDAGNLSTREVEGLGERILAALEAGRQIAPVTETWPDLGLEDAYRVSGAIAARRGLRGERIAGWKIGFTNRTIWSEYGVFAPIWGPVYQHTLGEAGTAQAPGAAAVTAMPEPRIEPEIVFRLRSAPHRGMDEAALFSCIDAVGHGFEIVQSVYPGWRFRPADTVAACGLHGRLLLGPMLPVGARPVGEWLEALRDFTLALMRDGEVVERGAAENVLGGPVSALRHFVESFDPHPFARGLEPGDVIATGTVTRALPVAAGQHWSTSVLGLPIGGLGLTIA